MAGPRRTARTPGATLAATSANACSPNRWANALLAFLVFTLGCDREAGETRLAGRASALPATTASPTDEATAETPAGPMESAPDPGRAKPRAEPHATAAPSEEARRRQEGGIWEVRLQEPTHSLPEGAPSLLISASGSVERAVVFLHGWNGCTRVLLGEGPQRCGPGHAEEPGWNLAKAHSDAMLPSALVIPQLAWRAREGSPGAYYRGGRAAAVLSEAASKTALPLDTVPLVVVAHSAGFESAIAWLRQGDLGDRVEAVVLFDALYAGTSLFAQWVAADPRRRLWSFHRGRGRTGQQNQRLARLMRARSTGVGTKLADADQARVLIVRVRTPHGAMPARHLAEVLRTLAGTNAGAMPPRQERQPSPPRAWEPGRAAPAPPSHAAAD